MAESAFGGALVGGTSGAIGSIKSISGGGQSLSAIETSSMDADTVTNLIGIIRGKPMTFTAEYEKATTGNYELIQAACEGRTSETWTVTWADTSTIACTGFVTDFSTPEGETESELTFTFEVTPVTVWDMTGVA